MDEKKGARGNWLKNDRRPSTTWVLAAAAMALVGFGLAGVTAPVHSTVSAVPHAATAFMATGGAMKPTGAPGSMTDMNAVKYGPVSVVPTFGKLSSTAATPGCASAPCPMGITDYGISPNGSTYTKTAKVAEAATDVYGLSIGTATGGGCLDPDAVSLTCFSNQLNVVTENQYVKNTKGSYWLQNVPEVAYDSSCSSPCVSGAYSVTFLDNIWNFSYSGGICPSLVNTGKGCINPGQIVGNGLGLCSSTGGTPEFYYCVGSTIYGVTTPFTIEAWIGVDDFNNGCTQKTGTSGVSCVNFYGAVLENGVPFASGYYDSVAFHSGGHKAGKPNILISDTSAPYGLPYDDEWVLGGPGGGSSVAVAVQGDMTSDISSCTSATCYSWPSISHAWSSGRDTAESVTDVYMTPLFNSRDIGYIQHTTDDPGTYLW